MCIILIVDANPESRSALAASLIGLADSILEAPDPAAGIAAARKRRVSLTLLAGDPGRKQTVESLRALCSGGAGEPACGALIADRDLSESEEEIWRAAAVDEIIVRPIRDTDLRRRLGNLLRLAKAERVLSSGERFNLAMDAAQDGVYDWDLVTGQIYFSPDWKRMLGYEDAELPNDISVWEKLTEPADVNLARTMHEELIARRRDRFEIELKMRHKEGGWVHVLSRGTAAFDERGEAIRIVGTHVDITERKRIEEELRISEVRFRSLFESVPVSLWEEDYSAVLHYLKELESQEIEDIDQYLIDHPEVVKTCAERVRICAVNQASLRLHKAESVDELLAGLPATFTPQSYVHFRDQLSAIWHGADQWSTEAEVRTLDGESRQVVINWAVPPEHRETLARVLVCLLDVSEKASLEHQLLQSRKMESIGRLAGGVAHDFNNILTVILNYSNIILDQLKSGDPLRVEIEQIRLAGERAADLTRQLLAFSRKQIVEPRVIDLNQLMQSAERMLKRLIGEHIVLEFDLEEGLNRVDMDPGQVNQVLVNLAVNARDAMPEGGRMEFRTRNVELDEPFAKKHPGSGIGPHVLITVSDSGHGIDDETLGMVFEPFFTTKPMDQGTGLGLATVYGIIKQGAGSIFAESQVGVGTTFSIYLPVAKREPEDLQSTARSESSSETATILLIEDEDPVREVTRRMLTASGYQVIAAADPHEALDLAREHGDSIDMILTDVVMPGMSGRDCYRQLGEIVPGIPALFMSGYTPDAIAHQGVLDEGMHFIQKPFTIPVLRQKLQEVLEQ